MPENEKEVTVAYFDDFFEYAVTQLSPGTHYELILVGSGSLILNHQNVVPSFDFDMLAKTDTEMLPHDLTQLIEAYAEKNGLGNDWINDRVGIFERIDQYTNSHYSIDKVLVFRDASRNTEIKIELPTVETVIYKKVMVNRDKDLEQAIGWFQNNGYSEFNDILNFLYEENPYLKTADQDTPWISTIRPRLEEACSKWLW